MKMVDTIKNFDTLAITPLRRDALTIATAGYDAINTRNVIRDAITLKGEILTVGSNVYTLSSEQKIWVVGAGKGSIVGAAALEEILSDRIAGGVVVDVSDATNCLPLKKIEGLIGTHPEPSKENTDAAQRIIDTLTPLTKDDLVIALISGGGSTLLCLPNDKITYTNEAEAFRELTAAGATIEKMNTVRKHISYARGGWIAHAAYPAHLIGLIFSDVPGNDISVISSGPTVKDTTTIADAEKIMDAYHLHAFSRDALIETPKEDNYFAFVHNVLLVTNERALIAMKQKAETLGYKAQIVTDKYAGESQQIAKDVITTLGNAPAGNVFLYGGESTVTLGTNAGKGGRNLEMALAGLLQISENEILMPFSSDGHDNTDYAGAICDTLTKEHAVANHLSIEKSLREHRSYDFFIKTEDALITGNTGANVSDLIVSITALFNTH